MTNRQERAQLVRTVEIDFLYLDLDVCNRCIGTEQNLEEALIQVAGVLEGVGVETVVRKTRVESDEQASELRFYSSPTIRVNGRDIALEFRESRCHSCEGLCDCNGTVNCRVWVWEGDEYTEAPTALIVDAILRAVYGGTVGLEADRESYAGVPGDLQRFFAARGATRKGHTNGSSAAATPRCCAPARQSACCEPSRKADGSGESAASGCGCH